VSLQGSLPRLKCSVSTRFSSLICPAGEFVVKSISKETNMASKAAMIGITDPTEPVTAAEEREGYCTPRASRK